MQHVAKLSVAATITAALGVYVAVASSSIAQEKSGRYVMNPVDGGFARLDTESGAMSICKPQSEEPAAPAAWSCTPMVDATPSHEVLTRKLENENRELRAEVKRMEDLLGLNGEKPKEPERHAERPGGALKLPSEQDVDKALSYMERMVKKFHDSMKRLEGKLGEKSDI